MRALHTSYVLSPCADACRQPGADNRGKWAHNACALIAHLHKRPISPVDRYNIYALCRSHVHSRLVRDISVLSRFEFGNANFSSMFRALCVCRRMVCGLVCFVCGHSDAELALCTYRTVTHITPILYGCDFVYVCYQIVNIVMHLLTPLLHLSFFERKSHVSYTYIQSSCVGL